MLLIIRYNNKKNSFTNKLGLALESCVLFVFVLFCYFVTKPGTIPFRKKNQKKHKCIKRLAVMFCEPGSS